MRCFLLGEDTDGVSGDDDDGCIALVRDYDSREGGLLRGGNAYFPRRQPVLRNLNSGDCSLDIVSRSAFCCLMRRYRCLAAAALVIHLTLTYFGLRRRTIRFRDSLLLSAGRSSFIRVTSCLVISWSKCSLASFSLVLLPWLLILLRWFHCFQAK